MAAAEPKEDKQAPAEETKDADAAGDTEMTKADDANADDTKTGDDAAATQTQTSAAEKASIQSIEEGGAVKLPVQLAAMLGDIRSHLQTFTVAPPHTLQRLAELVLHPRAHYKALVAYLHAVDRVVQVTSGINTYPLPPAIPDMSSMHINGTDAKDPASSVSWGNPTSGTSSTSSAAAAVGSDEALGGALLTPIPWLTRRSPENGDAASTSSGGGSTSGAGSASGAQIHSEGTETIDGPNGMGSIETVSVSVNGVPSTGHARGVTQGELLRQEQRAGVVPVSQLSRNGGHQQHAMQQQLQSQHADEGEHGEGSDEEAGGDEEPRPMDEDGAAPAEGDGAAAEQDDEEEIPHARGPDEIGVGDTGPQTATTSSMGESGLEMQGIDVAAAVGRPPEEEEHPEQPKKPEDEEATEGAKADVGETEEDTEKGEKKEAEDDTSKDVDAAGTKREAEDTAEGEPAKKVKEE